MENFAEVQETRCSTVTKNESHLIMMECNKGRVIFLRISMKTTSSITKYNNLARFRVNVRKERIKDRFEIGKNGMQTGSFFLALPLGLELMLSYAPTQISKRAFPPLASGYFII